MLFYFYFSYDVLFPVILFTGILFVLAILVGPIFIVYCVFRNPTKREKDYEIFKLNSTWLSLFSGTSSLVLILVVRNKWLGDSEVDFNRLIFFAMITAVLAFIIGIVALPRFEGFVAMGICCLVWYSLFYLPVHANT